MRKKLLRIRCLLILGAVGILSAVVLIGYPTFQAARIGRGLSGRMPCEQA